MSTQLLPVLNYRNRNLADYGCSIAVTLYFRIIIEAAGIFLVMFLLCYGAMTDNQERHEIRQACRVIASDPAGHRVLTEGFGSPSVSPADATRVTGMMGELLDLTSTRRGHVQSIGRQGDVEAAAAMCGYMGLTIYSFPNYEPPPRGFYNLDVSLGACSEQSTPTSYVATPHAAYCFDREGSNDFGYLLQLVALGVFLLWLKLWVPYHVQAAARQDDMDRITPADYSLMFSGLETDPAKVKDADALKQALEAELTVLLGPGKIHHIECGRSCEDELQVIMKLKALTLDREELDETVKGYAKEGKDTAKVLAAIDKCEKERSVARKRLLDLQGPEHPDHSTGHAFVAFHYEADRNSCAKHFLKRKGKDAKRPNLECASQVQLRPSCQKLISAKLHGEPFDKSPLRVSAAPEPEEILWENHQLTDDHEDRVALWGFALTYMMILMGSGLLVGNKVANARVNAYAKTMGTDVDMLTRVGVQAFPFAGSAITAGFNILLNLVMTRVTKYEGQDTQTEEAASHFAKLSYALIFNSALIPIFIGFFYSVSQYGLYVDPSWYEAGGVVSQGIALIFITYVTDLMKIVNIGVIVKRYILGRFAYSDAKLRALWSPPDFAIGLQYSHVTKTVALGLVFGAIYPPAYLLTSAGLCIMWVCTRSALKYWYHRPVLINQDMLMEMRVRLQHAALIAIIFNCVCMTEAMQTDDEGRIRGLSLVILLAAPSIYLLYTFVPLSKFGKAFQEADQLEEADSRSTLVLDTGGIAFGDVTAKKGFEMPLYHCPVADTEFMVKIRADEAHYERSNGGSVA